MMDFRASERGERRFAAYVEGLVEVIGHADRAQRARPALSRGEIYPTWRLN